MILLELDPSVVKPGWTPLIITVLLGVAVALLFLSMRKQFRKISIPREGDPIDPEPPVGVDRPAGTAPTAGAVPPATVVPRDPPPA